MLIYVELAQIKLGWRLKRLEKVEQAVDHIQTSLSWICTGESESFFDKSKFFHARLRGTQKREIIHQCASVELEIDRADIISSVTHRNRTLWTCLQKVIYNLSSKVSYLSYLKRTLLLFDFMQARTATRNLRDREWFKLFRVKFVDEPGMNSKCFVWIWIHTN
jgi:hypothetical protein